MRTRYRFLCRAGDTYYWESVLPITGDSRHVQYFCKVDWFWRAAHVRST